MTLLIILNSVSQKENGIIYNFYTMIEIVFTTTYVSHCLVIVDNFNRSVKAIFLEIPIKIKIKS